MLDDNKKDDKIGYIHHVTVPPPIKRSPLRSPSIHLHVHSADIVDNDIKKDDNYNIENNSNDKHNYNYQDNMNKNDSYNDQIDINNDVIKRNNQTVNLLLRDDIDIDTLANELVYQNTINNNNYTATISDSNNESPLVTPRREDISPSKSNYMKSPTTTLGTMTNNERLLRAKLHEKYAYINQLERKLNNMQVKLDAKENEINTLKTKELNKIDREMNNQVENKNSNNEKLENSTALSKSRAIFFTSNCPKQDVNGIIKRNLTLQEQLRSQRQVIFAKNRELKYANDKIQELTTENEIKNHKIRQLKRENIKLSRILIRYNETVSIDKKKVLTV